METFSALLSLCEGNSLVTGQFHSQRPVTQSFDAFFDLRLNKRLNKPLRRHWFETPSPFLWRYCNDLAPTKHQAIIWTNGENDHWRHLPYTFSTCHSTQCKRVIAIEVHHHVPPWYMQFPVLIIGSQISLHDNNISIKFEFWVKCIHWSISEHLSESQTRPAVINIADSTSQIISFECNYFCG